MRDFDVKVVDGEEVINVDPDTTVGEIVDQVDDTYLNCVELIISDIELEGMKEKEKTKEKEKVTI